MKRSLKDEPFAKKGEKQKIQHSQKAHKKSKTRPRSHKKAPYRKVSSYTKSVKQYKLERERRRQVRLLIKKRLTQQQIAQTLGISIRTVKRDWAKLQPYLKGQFFRKRRIAREEESKKLEQRYGGLSSNKTLKLLKQDLKEIKKSTQLYNQKRRGYRSLKMIKKWKQKN